MEKKYTLAALLLGIHSLIQAQTKDDLSLNQTPFSYYSKYHGDQLISPAPQQHLALEFTTDTNELYIEAYTLACAGIEQLQNLNLTHNPSFKSNAQLQSALTALSNARELLGFCLPHSYKGRGPVEQPWRGVGYFVQGMKQLNMLIQQNNNLRMIFKKNVSANTALTHLEQAFKILAVRPSDLVPVIPPLQPELPYMRPDYTSPYIFDYKRLNQLKTSHNPKDHQLYQQFIALQQATRSATKKLQTFELNNNLLVPNPDSLEFAAMSEEEKGSLPDSVGI